MEGEEKEERGELQAISDRTVVASATLIERGTTIFCMFVFK